MAGFDRKNTFPIDKNSKTIEDWEDLVNINDLVLSLFICSITALGGYFIAPNEPPMPLFFGLLGALIGFGISILITKLRMTFDEKCCEENRLH
ncbi:hypothetical protein [Neobacillus sp. PS3-40]|uniref:hypothetical protein n=1 Tax=Neobacillus sp. PS3-40 TaxID=3070679 RepID=UPI0027E14DEF|nr:hypothetical protein [Neobacillus sp. PS3-40]WML44018.1 hypothetical protein RCG20_19910 [Neobacillus sp. PS3-40]